MLTRNPFWHSTPIPLEKFIGRYEKLRSIASRISTGQSAAISGSPRSGKTSVLHYLMYYEKPKELYGDDAEKLIFSYLDAATWNDQFNKIQFWQAALRPLKEYIENPENNVPSTLVKAYQLYENEGFGTFILEKLFAQLRQTKKRLVLIVDEFDSLLHHPILKSDTEFFGGIRSIASNSRGTLAVIISTNLSVEQLSEKTQEFARSGSPYFNFMDEIILGALSHHEINKLLKQNNNFFTEADYQFIEKLAGGHPYLLQVLASELWELYEGKVETDSKKRHQQAVEIFYLKVEQTLNRTWHSWQPSTQQAFSSVALVQMEKLKRAFQRQGIDVESISKHIIPRLKSDLEFLNQYGFLVEDKEIFSGWRVYPQVFLQFFINKKLKLEYREKLPPEIWQSLLTPSFG